MSNRRQLEVFWREKWHTAAQKLESARCHRRDIENEIRTESLVGEDYFAYQQALKAENFALTEYVRFTRIYTDFLLHRDLPDEEAILAGRTQ